MSKYVDINDPHAFRFFSNSLETSLSECLQAGYDSIVILCIGTDRSTGDSLGPLTGYKLASINYNNVFVYGTLDNPVHAKNLAETLYSVRLKHLNPLIIAIDACLGSMDHVGYLNVAKGPLKPGSGVNKELPEVGHISITGIVNYGGFMDFLILQNTRLSVVMKMADLISMGLKYVLWRIVNIEKHQNYGSNFSEKQLVLD